MNKANASLAVRLLVFSTAMFAFGFFVMPPLYDVFCEVTGFGGRTNSEAQQVAEAPDLSREIRIEFVATVNNYAPWELEPVVDSMTVNPGKMYYATFNATNLSDEGRVGQAVPSVAPVSATQHFQKIECFCFDSQEFAANEQRSLPLQFIVDPNLPEYVDTITLSYTYFESTYVTRR
ncbi:MAG: cytochrome c oxidase assembly protein [Woeseiaceae bacterium]